MNIPEELINHILSFRPKHPNAISIERDYVLCKCGYYNEKIIYRGSKIKVIPHDARHPLIRAIRKDINKWNKNRTERFEYFYFRENYKRINLIREKFNKKYNIEEIINF